MKRSLILLTAAVAVSTMFIGCANAPFVVSENELAAPFFNDTEVKIFDDEASARAFINSEVQKFHDENQIQGPTKAFNGYFPDIRGTYENRSGGKIALEYYKVLSDSDRRAFIINFIITSDTGTFLSQRYMLRNPNYSFSNNSIQNEFKLRGQMYKLKVPTAYTDNKMWGHISGK
ncbi:hypothetical protein FACS1894130_10680 [Spirochaetia bacterium]|nr:hypothetical protein FACS1894130_10680 [Spirochaetia bacterium]